MYSFNLTYTWVWMILISNKKGNVCSQLQFSVMLAAWTTKPHDRHDTADAFYSWLVSVWYLHLLWIDRVLLYDCSDQTKMAALQTPCFSGLDFLKRRLPNTPSTPSSSLLPFLCLLRCISKYCHIHLVWIMLLKSPHPSKICCHYSIKILAPL